MVTQNKLAIGTGFYNLGEAARLLGVEPDRVRRWVAGYTFLLHSRDLGKRRRVQTPVLGTDLPVIDRTRALSFVELMELRVVKAFLERGVPLQRIRTAAFLARENFGVQHPFASRKVYTAGKTIFAELAADISGNSVVELTKNRFLQIQSGELLASCLDEIEFNESTSMAHRWWPLSRDFPVVLDPAIAFGAPIIAETAVRTSVVAGMARGDSVEVAATSYGLTQAAVSAAVKFEELLAAA